LQVLGSVFGSYPLSLKQLFHAMIVAAYKHERNRRNGMDAIGAQKEIIQLLVKRLKACALESFAYYGALMNLTQEDRSRVKAMVESYRQSVPIQQKVESQFRDLDSLIQLVEAGLRQEEWRKLLEQCDPDGKPN
jgi:hypothetical protein